MEPKKNVTHDVKEKTPCVFRNMLATLIARNELPRDSRDVSVS